LSIDMQQAALPPPANEATGKPARPNIIARLDFERWQSSTKVPA
jgi:hypothetical protein